MKEEQGISKCSYNMKRGIYKYKIIGWRKYTEGLLIYKSDDIHCIINNPVDYVIDGITFINAKKIKKISKSNNILKEKIMNYKFDKFNQHEHINFQTFKELFQYLKVQTLFCALSLTKENVIYIGKIINIYDISIDIDFYDVKFQLLDKAFVKFQDIKMVTILSDYVNTFTEFAGD